LERGREGGRRKREGGGRGMGKPNFEKHRLFFSPKHMQKN